MNSLGEGNCLVIIRSESRTVKGQRVNRLNREMCGVYL